MDLREICRKAESEHQLTQRALAQRIGMQEQNLSAVLKGRRKLPAEAAIELSELTGIGAKQVWEAAKSWTGQNAMRTALAILAGVLILWCGDTENAYASMLWIGAIGGNANYGCFRGTPVYQDAAAANRLRRYGAP